LKSCTRWLFTDLIPRRPIERPHTAQWSAREWRPNSAKGEQMTLRRFLAIAAALAVCVVASFAAAGTASAQALVLHDSSRQNITGTFFNICDLSGGPDSPTFTASGRFQQQVTAVQISDLHFALTAHETTQLVGTYPDGRHVVVHMSFNVFETVNLDPISLQTGDIVLDSALVATSTEHETIQVAGQSGAPDQNYDATIHATFTPDLRLTSMVVDYRGGCSS
jgi:hypothetical protein